MTHLYNVERVSSRGTALYLAYDPDFGKKFWSTDAESVLEYDDLDEAQDDAETYGGEVFSFSRPGTDRIGGEVTRFHTIANLPDAFVAPVITLIAAE